MQKNQRQIDKKTNITEAQKKIISKREKRLSSALRENLKRRKVMTKLKIEST
jgi:hypothetical protein